MKMSLVADSGELMLVPMKGGEQYEDRNIIFGGHAFHKHAGNG